MKKFIGVFLVTTMAVSVLSGCTKSTTSSTNTESADYQTLVIGGSGPLTGDYAQYGISVKQGAQLAAEEINEKGGINNIMFDVKMEDDQADPEMAVNAYATLYDEGMKVSLGGVTSGACIAAAEEANKDGILLITPSGSQKECTQYDNAFRVCFTDPDQGVYSAKFIKDNNMSNNVAILYDKSNDYSAGITEMFEKTASEIGLSIATKQAFTDQSNTDFSVQLQAIKSSGADLLFLPIYAQEAAYVLTQAAKTDLDITVFGCDGLDGIIGKIGTDNVSATEGVILLTPFAADSSDPVAAAFSSSYQQKYNAVPDQFAADGYDAVYAIAAALEKAEITDINADDFNKSIISAMTEIEITGATGTMTWSADGEPTKTASAVKIEQGNYVAY